MNKKTALIFFGIIVIGGGVSFFTLRNYFKPVPVAVSDVPQPVDGEPVKPAALVPVVPDKPVETAATPAPVSAVPEKKDAPAATAPVGVFSSPEAAMAALAGKVGQKDFAGFAVVTGPEAIAEPLKNQVKSLIESSDQKLDAAKPFIEISKSADSLRWALNFVPNAGSAEIRQLYVDLTDVGKGAVDITKIGFPFETGTTLAKGVATAPKVAAAMTPEQNSDALTVAHAFSRAVIQRDFNTARELSDRSTVTDERVAALMIAVEEGNFALKEERPLVVTLSRDDITWVLTRVQSDQIASEFALELGRVEKSWKVNGLTFSKVLSVLSERGGAGDIAYSPIVDDPSGGDSLVLYFEFNEAGLTERTTRQLAIVAGILKQGEDRVIRINGHADAIGSDQYNIELSNKRAGSIQQALLALGVKPNQVITEAFGAKKPRKPNFLPDGSDNPGGRSQNRRAEVLLDF
ncbi:MAG: OmpA family protein [Verrucomicrobiales bacterium]|nr:OmpA family protein [Verrucomicrobiales bacterium]HQW30150.1 OmpA family protein [Verrucomicrobiales bacterium]